MKIKITLNKNKKCLLLKKMILIGLILIQFVCSKKSSKNKNINN